MATIKDHWYGSTRDKGERPGRVQSSDGLRQLPEGILRLAQAEYDRQYPGQPYERMQERMGLSLDEVVRLLADTAERHGAKPSLPATKDDKGRWLMPPTP